MSEDKNEDANSGRNIGTFFSDSTVLGNTIYALFGSFLQSHSEGIAVQPQFVLTALPFRLVEIYGLIRSLWNKVGPCSVSVLNPSLKRDLVSRMKIASTGIWVRRRSGLILPRSGVKIFLRQFGVVVVVPVALAHSALLGVTVGQC